MLRIGEFSMLSSISIHMLRNYDRIGLLVPEHINEENGYRYYDKEQLLTANRIIAMKEMGFSLDEIKASINASEEQLSLLVQQKKEEKLQELQKLKEQLRRIDGAMDASDTNAAASSCSIAVKMFPDMIVVSYQDTITEYSQEGRLWNTIYTESNKNGILFDKDTMAMAVNHGRDAADNMEVEVLLSIKKEVQPSLPLKVYRMESRKAASVVFKGNYEQFSYFNRTVAWWLEKNEYEINGTPFSIYHNSPGDGVPENEYITEICFPIAEKIKNNT